MTFDIYAYVSNNLKRLSGVLGEPRIIHDFRAGSRYRVIAVLQHLFKYQYQSKNSGSLTITQFTNQLFQTLQTKFDNYYKPQQQWSGMINIYITHKINILPKDHTFTSHRQNERQSCSTIQNRSAHEAHLQQGSTNPEHKSTQQDLTEILTDNLGMQAQGFKVKL